MKHAAFSNRIFRRTILLGLGVLIAATVGMNIVATQKTSAASLSVPKVFAADCNTGFFGLEPWYKFMPDELGVPKRGDLPADPCAVRCFNIFPQQSPNACGQTNSDVPGVILAIIDNLLRIAGVVAVFFVLKGSFEYVGSRGNSEKTAAAQSTIIAALTGLAIAIIAVALISYIGRHLIT